MREDIVQAVRDAIEENGELVTYKDAGIHDSEVWVNISHDVEVYTTDGTQRMTTARGVRDDFPSLSNNATFVTAGGDKYGFMKTIKDDGFSILMLIGKVSAA